jgi:O-succinylbenzoate synthase
LGGFTEKECLTLLQTIQPAYIILKPSLLGGFQASEQWIKWAESQKIGWWVTSALESNVGLNAIAQWTLHPKVFRTSRVGDGIPFYQQH